MKRLLYVLIFACVIACFACPVSAVSELDSLEINDKDFAMFADSETDIVVRYYWDDWMDDFAEKRQIEDMISFPHVLTSYVVIPNTSSGKIRRYSYNMSGECYERRMDENLLQFIQYALFPERVFESSVVVSNVYILDSANKSGSGTGEGLIYYITSQGDYVLYAASPDYSDDELYILPVEDFYQVAATLRAETDRLLQGEYYNDMALPTADEVYDLSPYRLEARSPINPILYSVLGALAIVIIFVAIIVLIKRKKILLLSIVSK